ncbi:GAF and ANTAR domain-containing protein [Pseudonocardia sp. TRM90224]|uniref:GAF and ANTAR domain-containing protein n=1 Tax=Pseudonocardia sp. TRM90224 TaxID=2812678 RepID=UPI001E62F350|nr:GAF and ANTAR domain-containing protein [Pseudonocardia sp. TRM90224]
MDHLNREQQVSAAFVALADTLVDDYDIIDLLDQLVGHCVALLAADAAGLMLGDARRELRIVAASSEDAQTMELLQLQSDEGPCLDSYRTVSQVRVPDLSAVADRWPQFVAAVAETGLFSSVHAIPLRLRSKAIGVLNLFHRAPGALPEADLALGQALADVATIGILSERAIRRGEVLNEQLQTALTSRVIIEQAKGVIAQHAGVDMNAAFDRLRSFARSNNVRLSELARRIVAGDTDPRELTASPREHLPHAGSGGR